LGLGLGSPESEEKEKGESQIGQRRAEAGAFPGAKRQQAS
jgi:hypothetical protein